MGAGYEIPISVSGSTGWSLPNNFNAPTNFFFGSPGASVGPQSASPNQSADPTATSSAALGGNATSVSPNPQASAFTPSDGLTAAAAAPASGGVMSWVWIAAAAAAVWFLAKHHA